LERKIFGRRDSYFFPELIYKIPHLFMIFDHQSRVWSHRNQQSLQSHHLD
jgi:hypothetical protein